MAAGFSDADVTALVNRTLADATADQQGDFVVLKRQICTIRLPEIASRFTAPSPELVAMNAAIDAFAAEGSPGCFSLDPPVVFHGLNCGESGAGYRDHMAFMAASVIACDVRFFGTDPLKTPEGFQVVSGTSADVPDSAAIRANHSVMKPQIGEFVRQLGERSVCGEGFKTMWISEISDLLQGADATFPRDPPSENHTSWMWMEYFVITMAAGRHEGLSGTEKDTPRPSLCHSP